MKRFRRAFGVILAFSLSLAAVSTRADSGPIGKVGPQDRRALDRLRTPPLGLPPVEMEPESVPSAAAIALGRKLFFDRRLSRNGTMSCGMCHIPEQGFTNNELATPVGMNGRSLRRNAPTILNAAYLGSIFHDGRETSLETQVFSPLLAADEMANLSMGRVVTRVAGIPGYADLFQAAFGGGPTADRIGQAIASWERTLLAGESPFDRWYFGGQGDALSSLEQKGYDLFSGRAGCQQCHSIDEAYALFTDEEFHDTGIGFLHDQRDRDDRSPVPVEIEPGVFVPLARSTVDSVGEPRPPDRGRFEVTEAPRDTWRYRTPSLRNVALTAPYMHDGSLHSLESVVRFYARGGARHPGLDPLIQPLELGDEDVAALVAFLRALTASNIDELVADARSAPVGNW